ncbi:MAG: 4-hydroxy-tetrahydrodipicolinate synthase [Firmicutes bacterium]|nr:4-hydroxy-tetrahydrodipicolinate synthase [Bacillota bacterium]MCL2256140.1 4-hydroxy-tetrahydrodipicolinate synthase [Bacillota bacterium]
MSIFRGSAPAMITPFNKDGVDFDALKRVIEHIVKGGSDAIVVLGTTGEASTMTAEEKKAVADFTIKQVNKRIPVIVGAGSNNTVEVCSLCKSYEQMGADGLMVVTPYYNKATQNGIVSFFETVAMSTRLPIVAYNVPGRTALNMNSGTAERVSKIRNIVALKEASGNLDQILEICKNTKNNWDVLSGDDNATLTKILHGAKGVISVVANVVPDKSAKLAKLALDGKYAEALEIHEEIFDLVNAMFCETNPIPVKYAMSLIGLGSDMVRSPLTQIEKAGAELVKAEMKKLKLI